MSSTKAIAARIPMSEFLKFQQEAVRLKMSMNDFIIMKLYGNQEEKAPNSNEKEFLQAIRLHRTCEETWEKLNELHGTIVTLNPDYEEDNALSGIVQTLASVSDELKRSITANRVYPKR